MAADDPQQSTSAGGKEEADTVTTDTPDRYEEEAGRIWIQGPRYDQTDRCSKGNKWWCHLLELVQDETFSDTTISVQGKDYKCHKLFLSAVSPFFKTMYTCGLKESKDGNVQLGEMTNEVFERILEFLREDFYLEVDTVEEILELLNGAAFLRVLPLLDALNEAVERIFDSGYHLEFVAGFWKMSKLHGLEQLGNYCLKVIRDNFTSIDYSFLDVDEMKEILSDNNIQLDTCKEPADVIVKWVACDVEGKRKHMSELAKCLKLEDAEAFINEEKYIFRPLRYRGTFLEDAEEIKDQAKDIDSASKENNASSENNFTIENSDRNVNEPTASTSSDEPMDSDSASDNNKKSIAKDLDGTFSSKCELSSKCEHSKIGPIKTIKNSEETWLQKSTNILEKEKLSDAEVTKEVEEKLKAVITEMKCSGSGCYDSFLTRNVELNVVLQDNYPIIPCVYDAGSGEPGLYGMRCPEEDHLIRKGFAACTRGASELFISGGQSRGMARSRCMQRFDNETGKWKKCASMQEGRKDHAMFTHGNQLFVFGGTLSCKCFDFEEYDIEKDEWVTPVNNKYNSLTDMTESLIKACTFEEWAVIFVMLKDDLDDRIFPSNRKMEDVCVFIFSYKEREFEIFNTQHLNTSEPFVCPNSVLATFEDYVYSVTEELKVFRWKLVQYGLSYPEFIAQLTHGGFSQCTKFGVEVTKHRVIIRGGHNQMMEPDGSYVQMTLDDVSEVDLEDGTVFCRESPAARYFRYGGNIDDDSDVIWKMAVKMEGTYWFKMHLQRKWLGKKFVFEKKEKKTGEDSADEGNLEDN